MILIKEIKTKKELKVFVNFVLRLYKNSKYYIPVLYADEMKMLDHDYAFIKNACEQALFLAYKDNKVVGRIQGIIQKDANKKFNQKRVRFTRFDCIDDQEVSNALFDAVCDWAKQKGMNEICGPLGYNDAEREGLLIEGFDELGTYEEQYNFPYYQKLIENYGFKKDIDWVEFKLKINEEKADRYLKLVPTIYKHNPNIHLAKKMPHSKFVKTYCGDFFKLVDECYKDLYGTTDIDLDVQEHMIKTFSMFLNYKNLLIVLDENEHMVAFGLWIPSLSKALVGTSGKLTNPITLIKLIKAIIRPKVYDFLLCGILPEYRSRGLDVLMFQASYDLWHKYKLDHFETNLNLEDNNKIIQEWKAYDQEYNKRRRAFVKEI